jgi:hypothetical protein
MCPCLIQNRLYPETYHWLANKVFSRYPALFGADSVDQRMMWEVEVLWAATIIDSRAYGGRFDEDVITLIPVLDLLNHQNWGSFSHHVVDGSDPKKIVAYGKLATVDYEPVLMLCCLLAAVFRRCRTVSQGQEVWAAYTSYPGQSSCNHVMFQT